MWTYNSVFYQIYPIGFCGAPVHNDGVTVPRIRKIMAWSDYLKDLGVDSILLNPIFDSDNHGYDTRDFRKIDCRLGTNEDFSDVCKDLHDHDIKIVLDGVFNHVGRGFWAFRDVAYCLDREFMKRLRQFTQELKPDFALIGEVLFGDYNQIVNDEMLHSCTNYECYKGLYSSFNCMNMFEIAHSLHRQYGPDPWCIYRGKHLMNFVDNHDVTRLASILTNKEHIRPAYGLLMGMPGIPCLYYGSEWGEEGTKAPDNDYALRPCFDAPKPNELTKFIKKLIQIRQNSDALCNGSYRNVVIQNHQLIFERCSEKERILVTVNASDSPYTAWHQELNGTVHDLISDTEIQMDGKLEIPPYSTMYLKF